MASTDNVCVDELILKEGKTEQSHSSDKMSVRREKNITEVTYDVYTGLACLPQVGCDKCQDHKLHVARLMADGDVRLKDWLKEADDVYWDRKRTIDTNVWNELKMKIEW